MGRESPRASTQQSGQGRNGPLWGPDQDRRAARRDLWAEAATAAGYGDQPATRFPLGLEP